MPVAKLLIDKRSGALPPQPVKLVGQPIAGLTNVGNRYSVADLGVPIGRAGEAWDIAYEAVRETPEVFFEPDFPSGFPPSTDPVGTLGGAGDADKGVPNDQVGQGIRGPGFAWHRGDDYSQLGRARAEADKGTPSEVTVAICDVGFDLEHATFPADRAIMDWARNFLPDAGPTSVRDRNVQGFMQNPGHGTATMALLAAGELPDDILTAEPVPADRYLGAVPQAKVLPLRIATSVVLLDTSTFVQAMEHILELHAGGLTIDVVSMSMGGVGSAAWAEVVNRAYEAGITLVTAAGNNFKAGPVNSPSSTVFPARFNRVISATGVMANRQPYARITELNMRGNYGPSSKMRTAIAAYTPNAPWAELGSPRIIDLDGQGTSSATPQVAGAAALYLRRHKKKMASWAPWQVVEAVRHALWTSARKDLPDSAEYFGAGVLRAFDALQVPPMRLSNPEPADSVFLPAFDVIFGNFPFGIAEDQTEENARKMLWLETVQLLHRDANVEAAVADPDSGVMTPAEQRRLVSAILESPHASNTLKRALDRNYKAAAPPPSRPAGQTAPETIELEPPKPVYRRLQAYAFDPSLSGSFQTFQFNHVTLEVPWEKLSPGPVGEYVEIIDHDAPSGCFYPPVDLDHRHLLATAGLPPSTGNPQFHQQMVYVAAMRTIRNFELALGRRVQWSPRMKDGSRDDSQFVQQLRIHPHALRERNAYYHPGKKALLFGYFPAAPADPGELYSGGATFTCLSHDIIAHETTHAILDGIYRNFNNPTNPDQLAFHEAFADIVALLQHFTINSVLEAQIRRTRGNLAQIDNELLKMAREFGQATGLHGALRTAIGGGVDPETGKPRYKALAETMEVHDRGAILVAAVFDAFLKIYDARTVDLARIASGGTGVLPQGELHPDLVKRFAQEASQLASQFLQICIRALDYCPPVDLNFGDYLRALITADHDLVPSDPWGYRVAIAESFRKRGIFPLNLGTFGQETLLWLRPESEEIQELFQGCNEQLTELATKTSKADPGPGEHLTPLPGARETLFKLSRLTRIKLHQQLVARIVGLNAPKREKVARMLGLDLSGTKLSFEIHTVSVAERHGPDGRVISQFVITLVQARNEGDVQLWSGATLLLNRGDLRVRYIIRKSAHSERRRQEGLKFASQQLAMDNPYFAVSPQQRFALIHAAGGMHHE